MKTYQDLKARMKGQPPSNWSPVIRPSAADIKEPVVPFGIGLEDMCTNTADSGAPQINQTIYQSYEWYTPSWSAPINLTAGMTMPTSGEAAKERARVDTSLLPLFDMPTHYSVLTSLLPSLASFGITSVWLPPGCKGTGLQDNGYGIYDLYDLGEFECNGSIATKWGRKEELVELGRKAEEVGIGLLWDAVLNHRARADGKERARAVVCDPKDRTIELGPPKNVETWTVFNYPARKGQYSSMHYNWRHFSGIDWDDLSHTSAIHKFVSDGQTTKLGWSPTADDELGNYDYLMFADVDYSQPAVQSDVLNWAAWLPTQIPGLRGMRLDAIKHYDAHFQYRLLHHLRQSPRTKDWFFVGEYWRAESRFLATHIDRFAGHMSLFDVKLLYNLSDFSQGRIRDLRRIFRGSLVELKPHHAVTFVCNHDTQSHQSLAAPVSDWFIPHAHALILLRSAGTPCIFHGHIFGTQGPDPSPPSVGGRLMRMVLARKHYAYGVQHEYFDAAGCVGWTREGVSIARDRGSVDTDTKTKDEGLRGREAGLAVLVSSSWQWKQKRMYVGVRHRGETWTDVMGWSWDAVAIDGEGYGVFRVGPRGVGVWTDRNAWARTEVDGLVWPEGAGDEAV